MSRVMSLAVTKMCPQTEHLYPAITGRFVSSSKSNARRASASSKRRSTSFMFVPLIEPLSHVYSIPALHIRYRVYHVKKFFFHGCRTENEPKFSNFVRLRT